MIKTLLLFLLPLTLFGSKILSYNIYDRTDRVDVMITFDTPYDGAIKKSVRDSKIIIKLQDTSIESSKLKQLSSDFIDTLSIAPMSSYVQIVALVPQGVILKASKTSDSYGLRLRYTKQSLINSTPRTPTKSLQLKSPTLASVLPTKKDDEMTQSYYIVVAILIVGIIILLLLKNRITPAAFKEERVKSKKSWLMGKENKTKKLKESNSDVSIRFQKSINEHNSVVMLDFADQSYLVMMGSSNVLLDRFTDNKPSTQEDFESILQDRHHALEEFLETPEVQEQNQEPMATYRNKASTISYEV